MTESELAELLRTVLARPGDHEVLRVYADVLIERGDPRGELIVVQLAAESDDVREREAQLTAALTAKLRGELEQPKLDVVWREGFIDMIDIAPSSEGAPLKETFRALAMLTVARRLRRIAVRLAKPGWGALGPHIAELARVMPQLKAMRELAFTQRMRPGDELELAAIGKLAILTRACPKLEVLEVGGAGFTLADFEAPSLRRLVLEYPNPNDLWALGYVSIPRLEELAVAFRSVSANAVLGQLLALKTPKLHTLELTFARGETMRDVARTVLTSSVAPQLRVLALLGNSVDGKAAREIAKYSEILRKLERFEVQVEDPGDVRRLEAATGKALEIVYGDGDA